MPPTALVFAWSGEQRKLGAARGPEAFPFLTSVRVFLLPSYRTKDLNNSP